MKRLLLPLVAFVAVSCSANTPAKRIEQNPDLYASLDTRDQALVQQGRVENGMTRNAVYLAWGNPDSQAEGQDNGKTFERWNYTGLTPVYHHSFYQGYGYGWGRYGGHGRYRGWYPYSSVGLDVSYIPYRAAWVKFLDGRVESWQRGRGL